MIGKNNNKKNTEKKSGDKRKGFSVARLFQSNRFVLVFSVFTAIVLWFVMAINNTESRARVIYDVDIDVSLSEEAVEAGYQVFEQSDSTARVSVTGNSLTVNQLTSNDIKVSATLASNITRTGTYTLNLAASKNSSLTDYEFDTIYPGSIILFVDKYMEKTFDVEQKIDYTVADGYYATSPSVSETKITVSGPESEVSKVGKVTLEKTIDGTLKEPYEFTQKYTLYDKEGNKITDMGHMTCSSNSANVKIDVMKQAELPVTITYKNLPEGLDLRSITSVTPNTLKIGIYTQNGQSDLKEINLQPIDMTKVNLKNTTFSVGFELPENCTNISGVKKATVKFDLDDYTEETYLVDNFVVNNLAEGQVATVDTTQIEVTIVGPKSKLKNLKASDIYGVVDMHGTDASSSEISGSMEMPAKIQIDSKYGAWAYGSYTVYVSVSDANS